MRNLFPSSLLLVAVALPAGAQQADRAALVARIDSLTRDYIAVRHSPAVSIAVLRGSDTLAMTAYGLAGVETKQPATASTVFRIGSITKQFTSSSIMRLAEQSKLSLDDDMSKYLPDVPLHGHHVTIRELLNHTSGIPNYTNKPEWESHWAEDMTPAQVVALVARDTFDFAPGTKYSYDNTGYTLLGMIIEKITGTPYATYVQRELFTPLGLKQTSYCPSRPADPSFAAGYDVDSAGAHPAAYLSMTQPYAAGSICSTPRDLVKWQRALDAGRVVSAKSLAQMTALDTFPNGTKMTYGFGLIPGAMGTHRSISHTGGVNGFTSAGMYFPDDSVNVVVLTNSGGGPNILALNISRAVFGLPLVPLPRPLVAVALPDADRDRVPGVYDLALANGNVLAMKVTLEDGHLLAQAQGPGQGKFALVYLGGLRFGTPAGPTIFLTFIEEGGKITSLRFNQNGATLIGPRRS